MLYGASMTTNDGQRLEKLLGTLNRAKFAREHNIKGGGSMISQHVSGNRPISVEAAIAYARAFRCPISDISPDAAALIANAAALPQAPLGAAETRAPYRDPVSLREALEVLGTELARDIADDVREDVADQLHKLAMRRGSMRDQQQVLALLSSGHGGSALTRALIGNPPPSTSGKPVEGEIKPELGRPPAQTRRGKALRES